MGNLPQNNKNIITNTSTPWNHIKFEIVNHGPSDGQCPSDNKKRTKKKTDNKRQKKNENVNHGTGDGQPASEQHLDKHCHPLGAAEVQ